MSARAPRRIADHSVNTARRDVCSGRRMPWLRRSLVAGVAALATLALAMPALSSNGTEFDCEEAVAHLASCCPDLDPTAFDCRFGLACGADERPEPDFDGPQSECIQSLTCGQIQEKNICLSALAAPETVSCK